MRGRLASALCVGVPRGSCTNDKDIRPKLIGGSCSQVLLYANFMGTYGYLAKCTKPTKISSGERDRERDGSVITDAIQAGSIYDLLQLQSTRSF